MGKTQRQLDYVSDNLEPSSTLNQMPPFEFKPKKKKMLQHCSTPLSSKVENVLKQLNDHSSSINKLKAETRNFLKNVNEEELEVQKQTVHNLSQILKNMQEKYEADLKKCLNKIKKYNQNLSELQEKNECLEAEVKKYKRKIKNLKAIISEKENVENVGTETQLADLNNTADKNLEAMTSERKNVEKIPVGTQTEFKYLKNTIDKRIENIINEGKNKFTSESQVRLKFLIPCETNADFCAIKNLANPIKIESNAKVNFYLSGTKTLCSAIIKGILCDVEYAIHLLYREIGQLRPVGKIKAVKSAAQKAATKERRRIKKLQKKNSSAEPPCCQNTKKKHNNTNQKRKNDEGQKLESNIQNASEKPQTELNNQSENCVLKALAYGLCPPPNLLMHGKPKTPAANNDDDDDDVIYFSPEIIAKPSPEIVYLE